MIIFLIYSDLLNYLRSVGTVVITTENSLKVIFTEQFLTKATIFCCLNVFSVRPLQIFQVQSKISTMRPVFPDYFSVFYEYADIKFYYFYTLVIDIIMIASTYRFTNVLFIAVLKILL